MSGTLVVSSNTGAMASARIWHACDGDQQVERVESLTGAPRSTFRRNDEVVTFLPEARVARTEKRESLGLFPNLLKPSETSIPEFYAARRVGGDRVAGFETDVVQLAPKDNLRFGYRIWSEKKTGLVVKLQTLDLDGSVLEQAAFSELAARRAGAHGQAQPDDGRDRRLAGREGRSGQDQRRGRRLAAEERQWPGSSRSAATSARLRVAPLPEGSMQWIFSDGLASVSLFVEAYDRQRHAQEGLFSSGATQTLTRRIQDWWLTAVGEVPPQTLKAFAQNLERRK